MGFFGGGSEGSTGKTGVLRSLEFRRGGGLLGRGGGGEMGMCGV